LTVVPNELLSTLDASTRERAIQRLPTVAKVLDLDAQMKADLAGKEFTEDEKATPTVKRYQTFSKQSPIKDTSSHSPRNQSE
jgi:hypothetical protein